MIVLLVFSLGLLTSLEASAAWMCSVTAERELGGGFPAGTAPRTDTSHRLPPPTKDKKTWEYRINLAEKDKAIRHAKKLFFADFNRDGWYVKESTYQVTCDEIKAPPPKPAANVHTNTRGGIWVCHVAGHWQGISSKSGKFANGWAHLPDEGSFPGKTEEEAKSKAYQAMQSRWAIYDGAGLKHVSWSQLSGRCWTGEKPAKPLGWPSSLTW